MQSVETRANQSATARLWEVDALRGVAIVMMVIFHLMWDFWAFRIMPGLVLYAGFWKYFQRTTAITFLLLVGLSLTISYRRTKQRQGGVTPDWFKFFWRGSRIFAIGMLFTLFGWVTGFGEVHIGILHFIGLAIAIVYPLLEYRWVNLILWAVFYILGGILQGINLDHNWLVWFGLHTWDYRPLDYFPLIPWLGVVLLGVFLGNTFYDAKGRLFLLPAWGDLLPIQFLRLLGRHSLLIYALHQPIMIGILYLLGYVNL